jgi:peptidoglycan-N-acetylglucosamine deacetylase
VKTNRGTEARPARHLYEIPGTTVRPGDPVIALTFDDGPSERYTPRVLEILAHYDVTATFFLTGTCANESRDLVRATAAAGHTVGNHTWSHPSLVGLTEEEFAEQVDHAGDMLAELAQRPVRFVRPPYGDFDDECLARLRARGLTAVRWSVDPLDWKRPPADVLAARVLDALHPGTVILLHDGGREREQMLAALPLILEGAADRGYATTAL